MPEFTEKYEELMKRYPELGKEKEKGFEKWGVVRYKDRWESYYTSPELSKDIYTSEIIRHLEASNFEKDKQLNIMDFGGAEGLMLKQITDQLKETGFKNINAINVDVNEKALEEMNKKYGKEIKGVKTDVLESAIKENSQDVVVSRHLLQYFGERLGAKKEQTKLLKEIYRALKPKGLCILIWPGAKTNEQAEKISAFYASVAKIFLEQPYGKILVHKWFSSTEEVRERLQKTGFEIKQIREIEDVDFRITPEAFVDRWQKRFQAPGIFKRVKEQFQSLAQDKIFNEAMEFDEEYNSYKQPIIKATLVKPKEKSKRILGRFKKS